MKTPLAPHDDAALAQRVIAGLAAEAARVHPEPDAWQRFKHRIAAPPVSAISRWRAPMWSAAAVIAVVAIVITTAQHSRGTPSHTAAATQPTTGESAASAPPTSRQTTTVSGRERGLTGDCSIHSALIRAELSVAQPWAPQATQRDRTQQIVIAHLPDGQVCVKQSAGETGPHVVIGPFDGTIDITFSGRGLLGGEDVLRSTVNGVVHTDVAWARINATSLDGQSHSVTVSGNGVAADRGEPVVPWTALGDGWRGFAIDLPSEVVSATVLMFDTDGNLIERDTFDAAAAAADAAAARQWNRLEAHRSAMEEHRSAQPTR